jgi:hypothetical protein
MAREQKAVDISNMPELVRIVEAVRSSRQAQVLRRDNEDVALVVPLPRSRKRNRRMAADHASVLATAGSWKDLVDAEALKEQLASERGSERPTASL